MKEKKETGERTPTANEHNNIIKWKYKFEFFN